MRKSLFILYLILQTICSSVFAQSNYPIYVTPTLTPPYSLNLSDYSQFGSQKLMVTIHANDLDISNLPIKLRIKLETVGVTIENPPTLVTTPIYVNGGETTILYGRDLLDYFNIDNLIFRGYSKNDYTRTGQLPEGFYKFTVEVLHFNTNRLISNQGSASAWFALGKPPLLKLPENNAEMGKFKGMPLSFSWLSSNVGSPVSANTIQYKFEMWEMHVPGINPNTVALTMPVFHEYTTLNTIYTLYPDNLLMTPGMQYAWRITASDLSGYVPFEQNGHSEIRTFVYKAACDSITNLESLHRGRNGYFSWEPKANHTSFNIELQNPETNWFSNSETFENKAEFFDLDYGTTYQMRVQAVCDGDPDSKSDFSEWKTLKIPVPEPPDTTDCPDCACDNDMPDVELQNFDLRKDLQPGDILSNKTGTSRFIIKTVEEQGDGVYEGVFLFWAEIWNIKFICNYWDLQVNTDNVIVNMDFESIYDPQFLVDVDATFDYLDSIADVVTTLTEDVTPDDTLTVDGTFETIYVNEGDSVIIVTVDDDGNITEEVISDDVDEIEEFLIEGEDGEEYVITRDGQVMDIDEYRNTGGGNSNKIDDYNEEKEENELSEDITVDFKASSSQKYGFDQYNEEKSAIKNKYPSFNNGYTPTYKSVASFGTDLVGVSNTGENIIFKDEMGIPAIKSGDDLTLRGSVNGSDVALYAYQVINDTTEKIAGKLNVLSFDQQYKRLYIVPVNGATVPDETALQEVLNKIYGQAVTRWEVTRLENLDNVIFENENMTHGGTSAISVYNSDQKTIVNTFEERVNTLEKDAFYLFFVENVTFKERSIAGYMPLQYQVGFIYDNPKLNIIAHELGHGAFNLAHTFDPEKFIATEHTTENLMDYKGGIELWKHQWQLVQNPQKILFGWSQDEEEGEFESYEYLAGKNVISGKFNDVITSNNSNFFSFVSSAGKIISVPNTASDVTFHDKGTLLAFTIPEDGGEERYVAAKYNNESFAGFLKEFGSGGRDEKVYVDAYSKTVTSQNAKVYFGIVSGNDNSEDTESNIECGIYMFEGEIEIGDLGDNTGGHKLPRLNLTEIKNKLTSSYENENVKSPYGEKLKYINRLESYQACNSCERGKEFTEKYSHSATNEEDKIFLQLVVEIICQIDTNTIDYSTIQAQIDKDFQDNLDNLFWKSDKALYKQARNSFWQKEDAWEQYYNTIIETNKKINNYNNQLEVNASKEDYYAALFYLNETFLSNLSVDERIKILKTIFEHNFFITESLFDSKRSDVSMIKKILRSLDASELNTFVEKIIAEEQQFNEDKRDVLFEIGNALDEDQVKQLELENIVAILKKMLDGRLTNIFGTNEDAVVGKMFSAVKNSDADAFLQALESEDNYIDNAPLIFHLKNNLSDFLNSNNPYTNVFVEIIRLSNAKNKNSSGDIEVQGTIIWDVEQKDYVLISLVRDRNDFTYEYNNSNHKVNIKTCKNYEAEYAIINGEPVYQRTNCTLWENVIPENTGPFDLVGITILNDVSPFGSICKDGQGNAGYCGEMIVVPAIFIDYLISSKNIQRWKNVGMNTFNVIITAATFGEGAVAINAIRMAQSGTKLAVLVKNAYTLADFAYTVTDMTFSATDTEMGPTWDAVGVLFAAKTGYDLLEKGGTKGLAYLKKASIDDKNQIIDKLDIMKDGKKIKTNQLDEFIETAERKILNSDNPELKSKYQSALDELGFTTQDRISEILSKIDNPSEDFKNWLNSIENSTEVLNELDNLGADLSKFYSDFPSLNGAVDLTNVQTINSWKALSDYSTIRKKTGNLETLNKIRNKFTYNGKSGQNALEEIFTGHSSVQKFIDNLNKSEEIFDGIGIKHWSGIKSSSEVRLINDNGIIIGKIEDGIFSLNDIEFPNPNTYLKQDYINKHLDKFSGEVSTLSFENSINTYGQIGRDDGLFILTKSEMDDLLQRTEGNISLIEKELGITTGTWSNRINDPLNPDKLVRININNSKNHNLRMATGNEDGANNLWLPGGKTSENLLEAVIDPIPVSNSSSYTKTVITQ